jgi:hypothetical protein
MIKFLAVGIWTILLLSGSVYLFYGNKKTSQEELIEKSAYLGKLEVVKLEPMSITIIRQNKLQGYVILDISFTIETSKKAKLSVPAELLLRDVVNSSVFGNTEIDINHLDRFDFKKFKEHVLKKIHNRFGKDYISDVLIERIDFINNDSIRDKKLRGG